MPPRATSYPTKAEIDRVVKSMKAAGLEVGGVEITRDGTIRVLSKLANSPASAYYRWKQGQLVGE